MYLLSSFLFSLTTWVWTSQLQLAICWHCLPSRITSTITGGATLGVFEPNQWPPISGSHAPSSLFSLPPMYLFRNCKYEWWISYEGAWVRWLTWSKILLLAKMKAGAQVAVIGAANQHSGGRLSLIFFNLILFFSKTYLDLLEWTAIATTTSHDIKNISNRLKYEKYRTTLCKSWFNSNVAVTLWATTLKKQQRRGSKGNVVAPFMLWHVIIRSDEPWRQVSIRVPLYISLGSSWTARKLAENFFPGIKEGPHLALPPNW